MNRHNTVGFQHCNIFPAYALIPLFPDSTPALAAKSRDAQHKYYPWQGEQERLASHWEMGYVVPKDLKLYDGLIPKL